MIAPTAPPTPAPRSAARLGEIRSWAYQLQRTDPERIARSQYDLVVVDYSRNGLETGRFSSADVARMQRKPDGSRRLVLAYMSIGEAEDYRYYWRDRWVETVSVLDGAAFGAAERPARATIEPGPLRLRPLRLPRLAAPPWLGRENESWPGNFHVRYWERGWQDVLYRSSDSYLGRILGAGFDGVYLDRIDAFATAAGERPEAGDDMIKLVAAIAETARRTRPGFLVVPQNGEQLLADPGYLGVIDAIGKEDLLYGEAQDGARNPLASVARSMRWLAAALNRGLPVLVVEYVQAPSLVTSLRSDILARGFVPYFGVRALDRLVLPEDLAAALPPAIAQTPRPGQLLPPPHGAAGAATDPVVRARRRATETARP